MLPATPVSPSADSLTLGDLHVNDSCLVEGYATKGEYRLQLLAMGLTPGTLLRVVRQAPMGGPIQLELRGTHLSLRRQEAQCVRVQKR